MTTQRKLTRPGAADNEFMTVTCTPNETHVEFFELESDAGFAARDNLNPGTTTYVGKIIQQGEHAVRGTSSHIAICMEIDAELRQAIFHHGIRGGRRAIAQFLWGLLNADLEQIRSEYSQEKS